MEKIKVLIADDMEVIAESNKKIVLQKDDFEVIEIANNGQEEYDKIIELAPDLVITDNQMPKLNGIDVIEKIVNSNISKKPKFILITGDTDTKIYNKCKTFGAYIINKPVREDSLLYLLDEITDTLNNESSFDYEKWHKEYTNKEIVNLKKHFNNNELKTFKKLGIEIEDKVYTHYEYDVVEMKLLEYYKDKKEMTKEDLAETKSLFWKFISRKKYNELLDKFYEIGKMYKLK